MGLLLDASLDLENLRQAFGRVADNDGCAGVDGETIADVAWDLAARLQTARRLVLDGGYTPSPLLGVQVRKSSGGLRTLAIPTVIDRVLQTAVARVIGPSLDLDFEDVSFGYRPGRSIEQALESVRAWRSRGYDFVVDADIDDFFDSIDHGRLLEYLRVELEDPELLALIALWLRTPIRIASTVAPRERGVPQGSPLSPLWANLYLDPFDRAHVRRGLRLIRYADDFLILCRGESQAEEALAHARDVLADLGLTLDPEKTAIRSFDEGFQFLGRRFQGSLDFRPEPDPRAKPEMLRESEDRAERKEHPLDEHAEPERVASRHRPWLRTVYLTEHGLQLRIRSERFVVLRTGGEVALSLPAIDVDQFLLFGYVQVSAQALHLCLRKGIAVSLHSSAGRLIGRLTGNQGPPLGTLRAQMDLLSQPGRRLELAKSLVHAKIRNARTVLRQTARHSGEEPFQHAIAALGRRLPEVDRAVDLSGLRGVEGLAARDVFRVWRACFEGTWGFVRRQKRPATDPVNALLSFASSVVYANAVALLTAAGLEPSIGVYHEPSPGHASLASDLVDEFRAALIERTVMALLRQQKFERRQFESLADGGVRLDQSARRTLLSAIERAFQRRLQHPESSSSCDYRRAMAIQASLLRRSIESQSAPYQPLIIR